MAPLQYVGGRRFVLCVGIAIVSSILLWFDKINATIWRDVIIATAAVYIAGNVGGKYVAGTGKTKPGID